MNSLNKILNPLKRGIALLVNRATLTRVSDEYRRQNLQLKMQADEVVDNVERFQQYGFSSFPSAGEAIVLSVGGKRSHLVAISVEDKNVRPTSSQTGEVVIYHQEGHEIRLKQDGVIEVKCKQLKVQATDQILFETPQTQFSGDVVIMGVSTAADHISSGVSGAKHVHTDVSAGLSTTGKPI